MTDFEISFGQIARTLVYEDVEGGLIFCWEIDAAIGEKAIFLQKIPLTKAFKPIDASENDRAGVALKRICEYLVTRGYDVHLED